MERRFFKKYKRIGDDKHHTNNHLGKKISKPNVEASTHTYKDLASNLVNSLIEWQRSGRKVVTSEQWTKRLTICRGCEFWSEVYNTKIARCKKCGCSSGKLLLATSSCPLNPPKWNKEI